MAAKSFLRLIAGRITEIAGLVTSAGAADDGKIPALDSTGRLDISMMPVGVAAETKSMPCSENLADGDFVDIYNAAGTLKCRKADATASGKEADGFVLASYLSGATAVVYLEGTNTHVSGLTLGSRYYLSTTAGTPTDTPPSASGNVVQYIGTALSATELTFEPDSTGGIVLV